MTDQQRNSSPGENEAREEMKIVVSVQGSRATIGVQKPGTDPRVETREFQDYPSLMQEVPDIVERAKNSWLLSPKYPEARRKEPRKGDQGPAPENARLF